MLLFEEEEEQDETVTLRERGGTAEDEEEEVVELGPSETSLICVKRVHNPVIPFSCKILRGLSRDKTDRKAVLKAAGIFSISLYFVRIFSRAGSKRKAAQGKKDDSSKVTSRETL